MKRVQTLAALGLVALSVGSLAASGGYAWYLRSERYRLRCGARLSAALGLPSDIGRIVPRSRAAREFDNVVVWLPGRRDEALTCARAIVVNRDDPAQPGAYEIQMLGGACEISTRTWLRDDYRRVIESGLRPGFSPDGPRQVTFSGMKLQFVRDGFTGLLEDAAGSVVFDSPEQGRAAIQCRALNGFVAPEAITLAARFSPHAAGVQVDELTLRVPNLPLKVLGLGSLLGVGLQSGRFNGQLTYSEAGDQRRTTLSGRCYDLSLAECTAGLASPGWRGSGREIDLEELTLVNGRPQRLRFSGVLTGVMLGDLLAPWGMQAAGGETVLQVRTAELSPEGIDYLVASGQCDKVSLHSLSAHTGGGRISGTARLVVNDLTIRDNHLAALDADVRVLDNPEAKWIEGRLVTDLFSRLFKVQVPPVLPESIEYTQLGARLEVRDEVLYLFGTHGQRDKTILTVKLFDYDVPLVFEPEQGRDLSAWFDGLRAQFADYVRRWEAGPAAPGWEALANWRAQRAASSPPGSAPAGSAPSSQPGGGP